MTARTVTKAAPGRVRPDGRHVDLNDAAALAAHEGEWVFVEDATGEVAVGLLAHDGNALVVKLFWELRPGPAVRVRLRSTTP